MKTRSFIKYLPYFAWVLTLALIIGWGVRHHWPISDYPVYTKAAQQVNAGIDPYLAGVAARDAFFKSGAYRPGQWIPIIYFYPPITLPALKLFGSLPAVSQSIIYTGVYCLLILLTIWVLVQLAEPGERLFLATIAPFSLVLPGWFFFPVCLTANMAFVLYGLMFGAFWLGWKRDQWLWFYLAVILASCVKMPSLVYLAFPLLCRRRKWLPVSIAAACGVGLFLVQKAIWPELFRHYMLALNHVFAFAQEFGAGPAGRFSAAMQAYTSHYTEWGTVFYLLTAMVFFGVLLYFAHFYKKNLLTDEQWFPVMLLGVQLLYPRLLEYDQFLVTIPMALIVFRLVRATAHPRAWTAGLICLWIGLSIWIHSTPSIMRTTRMNTECAILLGVFAGGCVLLLRRVRSAKASAPALV